MDETALRILISSLNDEVSSLNVCMHFWTALVIAGCAGELISVIREYLDDRKTWAKARTTGSVSPPEKPSRRWLIFDIISVAAVVIGIAGELEVDRLSGELQTRLRAANGDLVLLLEKEAGDAKKSAEDAAKDAAKAKGLANDAGTKAAAAAIVAGKAASVASVANRSAKDVGVKAAGLDGRLTAADKSLVHIDTRRKELEAYLHNIAVCTAPRVIELWKSNNKSSIDPLTPFKGLTVTLFIANDPEASHAFEQLALALTAAEINVVPILEEPGQQLPTGVNVTYFHPPLGKPGFAPQLSDNKSRVAAIALVKFLHSYNWEARQREGSMDEACLSPNSIAVSVGRYPPPVITVPPAIEEFRRSVPDIKKAMKDDQDALHAGFIKQVTKGMPPEQAAKVTAMFENARKESEIMTEEWREREGDIQPCERPPSP